jgi:hypothetical protein
MSEVFQESHMRWMGPGLTLMKQWGQLGVDKAKLGTLVRLALRAGVGKMANTRTYLYQEGRHKRVCDHSTPNVYVHQQRHHQWPDGVAFRFCLFLVASARIEHDEEVVSFYAHHAASQNMYECIDETHYTPEERQNRE